MDRSPQMEIHKLIGDQNCPTGCDPGQGEWWVARRIHSPPFKGGVAAPRIKRPRSLAAQTGWLVISNKNKDRCADISLDLREKRAVIDRAYSSDTAGTRGLRPTTRFFSLPAAAAGGTPA